MQQQHAIYGLYLPDQPSVILYVGSWRVATLDERLCQHREGKAPLTRKMAAKNGVNTADLRMRTLAYWMSEDGNPEGEIVLTLQSQGQGRWNFPHTLSSGDCRRGAQNQPHEARVRCGRNQPLEAKARGGRIGAQNQPHEARVRGGQTSMAKWTPKERLASAAWSRSLKGREAKVRAGRIGGRISGRPNNCARWHTGRPKVDRLCAECAGKAALDNHPKPV